MATNSTKEMIDYLSHVSEHANAWPPIVINPNFLKSFSKNKNLISAIDITSYYLGKRLSFYNLDDDDKSYVLTELFRDILSQNQLGQCSKTSTGGVFISCNDKASPAYKPLPKNLDDFEMVVKTRRREYTYQGKTYVRIIDTTYMLVHSSTKQVIQLEKNTLDKINRILDGFLATGPINFELLLTNN